MWFRQAAGALDYGNAKANKATYCTTPDHQPAKMSPYHVLYNVFNLLWRKSVKSLVNYLLHLI